MRSVRNSLFTVALVAIFSVISVIALNTSVQAKAIVNPVNIDTVQIMLEDSSTVDVPATVVVYDSLYTDTVAYYLNDLFEALKKEDPNFDGSEVAVNNRIAERVKVLEALEAKKAAEEAARKAEAEKAFYSEINTLSKEVPSDLHEAIVWLDSTGAQTAFVAALMKYDVDRQTAIAIAEYTDFDLWGQYLNTAAMNYSQNQSLLKKTVEYNGPAHQKMMGQLASLAEAQDSIGCAVELTYDIATANQSDIAAVIDEINDLKPKVWTVWEAVKRTKIRKNQGSDNAEMMAKLEEQSKEEVELLKQSK